MTTFVPLENVSEKPQIQKYQIYYTDLWEPYGLVDIIEIYNEQHSLVRWFNDRERFDFYDATYEDFSIGEELTIARCWINGFKQSTLITLNQSMLLEGIMPKFHISYDIFPFPERNITTVTQPFYQYQNSYIIDGVKFLPDSIYWDYEIIAKNSITIKTTNFIKPSLIALRLTNQTHTILTNYYVDSEIWATPIIERIPLVEP